MNAQDRKRFPTAAKGKAPHKGTMSRGGEGAMGAKGCVGDGKGSPDACKGSVGNSMGGKKSGY